MSTIFAAITGRGGAVATLRLSGPASFRIAESLAGRLPEARRASLRRLRHEGQVLDEALLLVFPAPHSFTGEDVAEISVHGGRAVLAAVGEALVALGARPAEPGEFSRRAFENGRMNLLQAEATADLIAAETQAQRLQALDGRLHEACTAWRERLRQLMARQEALIDFPDEDLPPEVEDELRGGISALRDEMQTALHAAPAAERLREGLEFVILGPPNAGKSTLLNALAGEDVAIVSDIPGTTRDAVGVRVDLGGVPVHLTDTAGVRETEDVIEAEGVRRAKAKAAHADFVILVAGPGDDFATPPAGAAVLRVRTKADFADDPIELSVSAKTGRGMVRLRAQLAEAARLLTDRQGAAALARPRQVACVRDTVMALDMALALAEPELRGEELRTAAQALARLTGSIGVEEILDAVFSGFCIGK
ncbi:MAG: tRNA uridine-5-carboxymethylaminomethyl(34) synthesis GTPase MnmE [Rhodospirillales bacterium]|nr:tRNA uridine-5-carboxymethylaminomethyl(34) synthesis GTPase MnmE [Rhodospirillales bacterium]MDE2390577.1 tRNA uridine-5-carboxymethylaminomethyl(34) synthesis GTPase MnmE [Rhodospirillales bacterium]